ncbi:lipopolysaccharide biosynthesis protein [Psychroflexus sp. CAK57W]|uniref:lipopolysaccharide biosynthesis protein n=1 Tax=Psychroflexus curvus TaxID=2873595 RepID=UPI001CCA6817|nr:lipopolysaccharide biosynthesis protein [Psychroflexus curvus]MBZ9786727.1 lipopolysaccharide biosynthesis protein [Psychroflexus curvus]
MTLKTKATSGFIWNAVERFSVTIGHFVIGIVLARLLMPEDFGLIGMLSIFIAFSQVFIESGMGSGLIQKQDRTDKDYSTVFIFNLAVSLICYGILYLTAPFISDFYEMPRLTLLTRVLGLNLIFISLVVVQRTKLEIEVNFKTLARVNIIGLILGGGLAIAAALYDFGVWALVIQTLSISLFTAVGLWSLGNWRLSFTFSKDSFKKLFGYGSKLLIAGIYSKSLQEIYNLVIGKVYSASDLGYFTQAKMMSTKPAGIISSILQKVSFPILSSLQNDKKKLVHVYSKMIRMAAFITFPSMVLLAILAKPLIIVVLTEKWLPVVPLLQWLCLARIVTPISIVNMNILNAIGRSDLFLKVDLFKFPLIVLALIITIPIGLEAIVIGQVITSLISFFINAYLPGKIFGYGPIKQIKDISNIILATLIMSVFVFFIIKFIDNDVLKICSGLLVGMCIYIFIAYLLKSDELREIWKIISNKRQK